jgi:hypothetical protein
MYTLKRPALRLAALAACICPLFWSAPKAEALTFAFSGLVNGVSFPGGSPSTVDGLTFAFLLDATQIPDPGAVTSVNNIPLISFSGLTVGSTVFDRTNVLADVQNRSNLLKVTIGGAVGGVGAPAAGTDDFVFGFTLLDPPGAPAGMVAALQPSTFLSLTRAQISNSTAGQVIPGSLASTNSAAAVQALGASPVPLPPGLALGLSGLVVLGGLTGIRRRLAST